MKNENEIKKEKGKNPNFLNASIGSGYGMDTVSSPHRTLGSVHDHTGIAADLKEFEYQFRYALIS